MRKDKTKDAEMKQSRRVELDAIEKVVSVVTLRMTITLDSTLLSNLSYKQPRSKPSEPLVWSAVLKS